MKLKRSSAWLILKRDSQMLAFITSWIRQFEFQLKLIQQAMHFNRIIRWDFQSRDWIPVLSWVKIIVSLNIDWVSMFKRWLYCFKIFKRENWFDYFLTRTASRYHASTVNWLVTVVSLVSSQSKFRTDLHLFNQLVCLLNTSRFGSAASRHLQSCCCQVLTSDAGVDVLTWYQTTISCNNWERKGRADVWLFRE